MSAIMQMVTNTTTPYSFVTNGALLYVDAGNSSSYSGSGTTWTDLSTNTNNATLNGSPPFTSAGVASYFSFNGIGTQNATTASAKYVQAYTGKTVFMAARMANNSFNAGTFRGLFGTAAGSRNFNTYMYSPSSGVYQLHYSANGQGGFSSNLPISYMQWFIIAVTQTTGGLVTYYLNGQPAGTNTGVTFAQYANSGNTENIAFTDNYWYGDISVTSVYGRALSNGEITQNFNALRSRYGI